MTERLHVLTIPRTLEIGYTKWLIRHHQSGKEEWDSPDYWMGQGYQQAIKDQFGAAAAGWIIMHAENVLEQIKNNEVTIEEVYEAFEREQGVAA